MKPEEENSVFDILDDTQKLIKKSTGMDIRLPRPGKRTLEISSVTNGIIGASLIAHGLLTTHKWTMILGALGVASSIITRNEAKKIK